jgi:hypothetical protein
VARVLIVQPDGSCKLAELGELPDWQEAVGGQIEQIKPNGLTPPPCQWAAFVNEDGRLLVPPLPDNLPATKLAAHAGWLGGHMLVGPVVFFGDNGSEWEADVPAEIVDMADALGLHPAS